MSGPVTNNNLYEFINSMRLELKADINRVENKVDKLQTKVNSNEVKQSVTSTKLMMLIGSISFVTSALVTLVIGELLK